MKPSRKSRHLQRAGRHATREVEINIVSLIDIFAILVFYLLVNALAVDILPSAQALQLPQSTTEESPRQATVIVVTREDILVNQRRVMSTTEALAATDGELAALASALASALERGASPGTDTGTGHARAEVNIMADRSTPYRLLRKVMDLCRDAQYASISLAVMEKSQGATP